MLSSESLAIAGEVRASMARRWGDAALAEHFRTFDTICSATQDRQDAVLKLIEERLDAHGGDRRLQLEQHHAPGGDLRAAGADVSHRGRVVHRSGVRQHPAFRPRVPREETQQAAWLPAGPVRIGVTAGASTPNNKIGEAVQRIAATKGVRFDEVLGDGEVRPTP